MAPLWPSTLRPGSIHASTFHLLGRAEEKKRRQNLTVSPGRSRQPRLQQQFRSGEGGAHTAAGAFPSRHRRLASASHSAEATPPMSASQATPTTRTGSAHAVFQIRALRRLVRASANVGDSRSQPRSSCSSSSAFRVTLVTETPSDNSKKLERDQTFFVVVLN